MDMKILMTGATGTIGRRIAARVPGARVLSRDPAGAAAKEGFTDVHAWDGRSRVPEALFDSVDAVVHLAGEPIADGRWTDAKKKKIEESRVLGTRALVDSMRQAGACPRVLVSASAVGVYGDRGDEILEETSSRGRGFLSDVCVAWEREASAAEAFGVRVVHLRTGIVLDATGGAWPRMVVPFRLGLGGPIGDGRQWTPWIHVDDVAALVMHAIETDVRGPMNAVAPAPVRNEDLTRGIAHALHRPAWMRAPAMALRLALGELSAVVLASQRALPAVALRSGFAFAYPSLDGALKVLVGGDG
jgi:uncharacterized protein (TIGR01777 family)